MGPAGQRGVGDAVRAGRGAQASGGQSAGPVRGSRPGKRGKRAAREKGKRRRVGPLAGLSGLRWAAVGWFG